MPLAPTIAPAPAGFLPVPLTGLVAAQPVPFALYLRTGDELCVLYHPAGAALDEAHLGRLAAEGTTHLFVRDEDRAAYFTRVEHALDAVLLDKRMPVEHRAAVLHGVATRVAEELLVRAPERATLHRAQKVMMATSGLLLREQHGFAAIRRVMGASKDLASHSLTVGFLAMALARSALGADTATLLHAGLAGLLHDVGLVGAGPAANEDDPQHCERGASYLVRLGLPAAVVEAARLHHERHDGSGFPDGRKGAAIPPLAAIVGIADTLERIYASQRPRIGVFDALRILAHAYRGCFDERLALALVQLFR
jgi:putative nucleotidyltransferase with HDIG domain